MGFISHFFPFNVLVLFLFHVKSVGQNIGDKWLKKPKQNKTKTNRKHKKKHKEKEEAHPGWSSSKVVPQRPCMLRQVAQMREDILGGEGVLALVEYA